jgi:hypothetical protein
MSGQNKVFVTFGSNEKYSDLLFKVKDTHGSLGRLSHIWGRSPALRNSHISGQARWSLVLFLFSPESHSPDFQRSTVSFKRSQNQHSLDTMDVLSVLESMASSAECSGFDHVTEDQVVRWQSLFGFSAIEARKKIEDWRADVFRASIVTDELWAEIAAEKTAAGWDPESYEYSLAHTQQKART